MPPAVVPLLLVAIGVPAAVRAIVGRPRGLVTAWLAAVAAVAVAQVAGELAGAHAGLLGDAQVGLAAVASLLTSVLLVVRERASRGS